MSVAIELSLRSSLTERIDLRHARIERDSTAYQVAKQRADVGGMSTTLGELFRVEAQSMSSVEPIVRWLGDLNRADYLGHQLRHGHWIVEGSIGHHCGSCLAGGRITIEGSAGDYLGGATESRGVGMNGGRLWVHGDAGEFAGQRLRRGWLQINGAAGIGLASLMVAGTIVVGQASERHLGYAMRRGTVVLLNRPASLPPRFTTPRPLTTPFAALMMRQLDQLRQAAGKPRQSPTRLDPPMLTSRGDLASGGRGELWFPDVTSRSP